MHAADQVVVVAPFGVTSGERREPSGKSAQAAGIEGLIAEEDDSVLVEGVPDLRESRIVDARNVHVEYFRTNRSGEGFDPDF